KRKKKGSPQKTAAGSAAGYACRGNSAWASPSPRLRGEGRPQESAVTHHNATGVAPSTPTHESELRSSRPRKGGGSRKTARCTVSGTREHGRHRPHLNFHPTTCTSPSDICL